MPRTKYHATVNYTLAGILSLTDPCDDVWSSFLNLSGCDAYGLWCFLECILSPYFLLPYRSCHSSFRVGKQIVNIPSFLVRLESQKHIDFALSSCYGGGRPGRVKRRNMKAAAKKASGGDDGDEEEEDEE